MGHELLIFVCINCKQSSAACPECVNTILIDPETNLPPDAAFQDNRLINITPDPEAVKRSVKTPVCDNCIGKRGDTLTSEERHRRNHSPERDYLD